MLRYRPQLPTLVQTPPDGDLWLRELKHDGYRMGLLLDRGRARWVSRHGRDWTAELRAIGASAGDLPARAALLDGEVVLLLPSGRSSFQGLQNAFRGGCGRGHLAYYAFDLLHLDGENVAALPLEQRKKRLRDLFPPCPPARRCGTATTSSPADRSCSSTPASLASKASCRSGETYPIALAAATAGSRRSACSGRSS